MKLKTKRNKKFKSICMFMAATLLAATTFSFAPLVQRKLFYPKKYNQTVEYYCNFWKVDVGLCFAIIKAESGFNKNAKSLAGAIGLMQITLPTAVFISQELGEKIELNNLYDVETNIKHGTFYLQYLFKKFTTTNEVLAAYNAGEGRVRQWLKSNSYSLDQKTLITTPFKETNDYIKRVNYFYKKYTKLYK